ncbi:hypothetical protein ACWGQ2_07675 [Arthrobacter sp. NPDC055585]
MCPPALGRHSRNGRPYLNVLLLGLVSVLLVFIQDTTFIVAIANAAAIIAMMVVSVAAAVLGFRKWPGEGARLPLGPVIPIVAALAAGAQLPSLNPGAVAAGFILTAVGGALYLARRVQRGGTGNQAHANAQIDGRNTPLMAAARTVDSGISSGELSRQLSRRRKKP